MWKDVKEQWIKELRSGNWIQGTESLHSSLYDVEVDQYCCLGVLAAMQDHLEEYADGEGILLNANAVDIMGMPADDNIVIEIIDYVLKHYGESRISKERLMQVVNVSPPYQKVQAVLAKLNDDEFSFDEIADVIEAIL